MRSSSAISLGVAILSVVVSTLVGVTLGMLAGWFRGWTLEEILAYFTYLRICPQAERSGRWQGDGDGTQAPFSH